MLQKNVFIHILLFFNNRHQAIVVILWDTSKRIMFSRDSGVYVLWPFYFLFILQLICFYFGQISPLFYLLSFLQRNIFQTVLVRWNVPISISSPICWNKSLATLLQNDCAPIALRRPRFTEKSNTYNLHCADYRVSQKVQYSNL